MMQHVNQLEVNQESQRRPLGQLVLNGFNACFGLLKKAVNNVVAGFDIFVEGAEQRGTLR